MINVGEKQETTKPAGMPLLLAGRFRWSTAVQRLRETNRRAAGGTRTQGTKEDQPSALLWGEDEKV